MLYNKTTTVKLRLDVEVLFEAKIVFTNGYLHHQDEKVPVQICPLENSPNTSDHVSKSNRNFVTVVTQQNKFYCVGS